LNINTIDELALFELHDLEMLQARYKDQIRHTRRTGGNTGDLEVELSYVQRELHIRELRERYTEKMNRTGYREEAGV
jgi:hypothetical protein